jgi:hypothetical protein
MATKMIFSAKHVNTKVVENFARFPKSIITQISEFVCGIYDQTTKLYRDKSKQDEMTWWKMARCKDATLKLNQEHDLNQQYDFY